MDAGGIQSRGVTEPQREAGVKPLPDKPKFESLNSTHLENTMNNERIYPAAPVLTSQQRAKLRSMASTMSPVTQIGKGGVSENFITTVCDALEARELIKLSVLETSEYTPREAAEGLAEALNAAVVSVIGRKIILYRRSLNGKRHIEL